MNRGKPLGPSRSPVVEVVADGADDAHALARAARDRPPEHPVGVAGPVNVGRQHSGDRLVGSDQRSEALVVERLAEVHEAAAAPRADGNRTGIDGVVR